MATTAVACELLVFNTLGQDHTDVGAEHGKGTVAVTPADGWTISPPAGETFGNQRLVFLVAADATGDTITFLAGDRYPAQRADLGNLTVTLAAWDLRLVTIETSRFLQNDGTILATCVDAGTTIDAAMLPKTG